jgi:Polyketide cyclase / dehydrase and lipid transport
MMGRLSRNLGINSPPARVWKIIEKHIEHPEAQTAEHDPGDIQESHAEALSQQRSGVGTRSRWFYTYKGKPFVWDDVVTEWESEKRIAWKATSGWDMKDSFTLQPEENGTRLIYDMEYHLPYGPLGWLYGKLVLERRMIKHLGGVLARMKKLAENPFGQGSRAEISSG